MATPRVLTEAQMQTYREFGYAAPIRVFGEEQAAAYRARLEAFESLNRRSLDGHERSRSYLLFDWAYEICASRRVVDAVADAMGCPDVLIFHSTTWIKERESTSFVSWHQDSTYLGLEPCESVTGWIALTPATVENGCLRVMPGTHRLGQLPNDLRPEKDNLLSSGQHARIAFDESMIVDMPLRPGEMSLHHTYAVHGSNPNHTADRRIGIGVQFVPATARTLQCVLDADARCSALLVRGEDRFRHFVPERPPRAGHEDEARAEHDAAVARYRKMMKALGSATAARHDASPTAAA